MLIISIILGVSFFIIGVILKFFPSKKREAGYGYRTYQSVSNQDSWKEGNEFSGRFLLYGSLLGMIICILVNYYFNSVLNIIIQSVVWCVIVVLMIIRTEKRLKAIEN